jgi:predicted GIY-YIG superfamily endonuclease
MSNWFVYIIRCGDGTLYTGIAVDVEARVAKHRLGKGAKYTRGRGPLELVFVAAQESESAAHLREMAIKKMTKAKKIKLCYTFDK